MNTVMSEVEEKLANIIVTQFAVDGDSITPAARFQEDLEADTASVAGLITAVEEDSDIEIPHDKAEGLLTVGDLLAYIKSKLIR